MTRYLGWIAIAILLGIAAVALLAYGNPSQQSLDDRARTVAQQLRCPVCQGESVADSPSGIAKEMRTIIRRRLAAGQSPDVIKAYFVSRYGSWILLAPPTSGVGTLAWLAPPLLVLGGAALLVTLLLSWRSRGQAPVRVREDYVERVRAELAAEGSEGR